MKRFYDVKNKIIVNLCTSKNDKVAKNSYLLGHVSIEVDDLYISFWPRTDYNLNLSTKLPSNDACSYNTIYILSNGEYCVINPLDVVCRGSVNLADLGINFNTIKNDPTNMSQKKNILNTTSLLGHTTLLETEDKYYVKDYKEDIINSKDENIFNVRLVFYGLNKKTLIEKFYSLRDSIEGWSLLGDNILQRNNNPSVLENCSSFAYELLVAGDIKSLLKPTDNKFEPDYRGGVLTINSLVKFLLKARLNEEEIFNENRPSLVEESNIYELCKFYGVHENNPPILSLYAKYAIATTIIGAGLVFHYSKNKDKQINTLNCALF